MPAKIEFAKAAEAVYDVLARQNRTAVRLTRPEFFEMIRGAGIASSKDALRTLWAQAKYSPWNIYDGPLDMVLVSVPDLGREVMQGGVYTYTHTHTADAKEGQ